MKITCPICDGFGGLPRGGPLDDIPCPACLGECELPDDAQEWSKEAWDEERWWNRQEVP